MKSYAATDKGKTREMNQDYIFSSDEPVGALPNLYIVADGMGGYKAGDYASRCCVEEFVKAVKESDRPTVLSILAKALSQANHQVFVSASENPDLEGMGTTFVAATVLENMLYAMNVGDSRLYLLDYELKQITVDHSYVEEMIKKGELLRRDAMVHPNKNVITRAVGVEEKVEADYYEVPLEGKNSFLLLCSDGLTNMVEEEEIRHIMMSENEPGAALDKLIRKANDNGGKDNISAVIIAL